MSACRALELPLSVAFLGPEGTYTEAALSSTSATGSPRWRGHDRRGVSRGGVAAASDYGVVPVENSTEGVVQTTRWTCSSTSNLSICGEVMLPIHHCLMSKAPGVADVERVYSHQQSLGQCRKWLDENLPGARREPVSSNAEVRRMAAADAAAAAIAGRVAAEKYGVPMLEPQHRGRAGQHHPLPGHRPRPVEPSGDDKTSVMFWFRDCPGGLFQAIEVFATRGMNMTRIESRPSRLQRWTYVFYVDFVGHRDDERVREALDEAEGPGLAVPGARLVPQGDSLTMSGFVVEPCAGIAGRVRVPGDKSISHRALMLGAIATGTTQVEGFLEGEDCLATLRAVASLGVNVQRPRRARS